jgi:hypothetical protein
MGALLLHSSLPRGLLDAGGGDGAALLSGSLRSPLAPARFHALSMNMEARACMTPAADMDCYFVPARCSRSASSGRSRLVPAG